MCVSIHDSYVNTESKYTVGSTTFFSKVSFTIAEEDRACEKYSGPGKYKKYKYEVCVI